MKKYLETPEAVIKALKEGNTIMLPQRERRRDI